MTARKANALRRRITRADERRQAAEARGDDAWADRWHWRCHAAAGELADLLGVEIDDIDLADGAANTAPDSRAEDLAFWRRVACRRDAEADRLAAAGRHEEADHSRSMAADAHAKLAQLAGRP